MPAQQVFTDRTKEAIYSYGADISEESGVKIQLKLSGAQRLLRIVENGATRTFKIEDPKKPEDTPTVLLRFNNQELLISEKFATEFSLPTEKCEEQ